ncbi:MAG: NAD-dependent epimerase/dehydratase family protein [Bacteroidota bacterium]
MTSRNAFITGATGFIGSNLSKYLVQHSWNVHILLRNAQSDTQVLAEIKPKIHFHTYDGTTESLIKIFKKAKPDIVFHLASLYLAQHEPKDILPLIQSNIVLGTQILEAMTACGVANLVNAGTSWQHFHDEEYNPVCLYAATKQAFEDILAYYVEAHAMKAVTLKLYDTYGPNDRRKKLFYLLKKVVAEQKPFAMSPGDQLIDLLYIDDVLEAFTIAANRLLEAKVKKSESYALSSSRPLKLKSIAEIYSKITGKTLPIQWGGKPYRNREVMIPWTKGTRLPGWTPNVTLEEGIKKIIAEN